MPIQKIEKREGENEKIILGLYTTNKTSTKCAQTLFSLQPLNGEDKWKIEEEEEEGNKITGK